MTKTTPYTPAISMRTAAWICGLTLFLPTAPFAEFYVMQRLVAHGDIAATIANIASHRLLFTSGILCYLVTFLVDDVLLAWAGYIFLAPANRALALLIAWIRLTYAAVAIVSLLPLVDILSLVGSTGLLDPDQLSGQVGLSLISHYNAKTVGLIVFGIYLIASGGLVVKSTYIPSVYGICMVIAGLGYSIHSLQPFLFPHYNVDFLMVTFFGELIFGLWLLIKGTRIDEARIRAGLP